MPATPLTLRDLSRTLISMWWKGYVPIPGYTCFNKDDPYPGAYYIAVAFAKPDRK